MHALVIDDNGVEEEEGDGDDDDGHQVDGALGHEEGGDESQEGNQGCNAGDLPPHYKKNRNRHHRQNQNHPNHHHQNYENQNPPGDGKWKSLQAIPNANPSKEAFS